jgi:hypothetical protein
VLLFLVEHLLKQQTNPDLTFVMEQDKNKGDHANLMSFDLAPPPTPLQLHDLHLSHRGKKDEEREEMEEEAVIVIMAGILKVETFSTTTKAWFSSSFMFHHFRTAQILQPVYLRSKIQHPLKIILKIIWTL